MTTKRRSVLLAVITLVLCLALVAGGTYALFTDQVTMKNHLQAGTLDITLVRTNLTKTELDPLTGYLKTSSVDDKDGGKDFSEPTTDNVFGIVENETLIVPCSSYTASMKITNNSDAAFAYWIEIKMDIEGMKLKGMTEQQIAALKLDEQIKVTVTKSSGEAIEGDLRNGLTVGNKKEPIGKLAKVATKNADGTLSHPLPSFDTFKVCVEFLNLEHIENNLAQGQKLSFDLIVYAVQLAEEAPKAPGAVIP